MSRPRRKVRTARWFAAYTVVLLAVAAFSFARGELSVGFTILLTAIVLGLITRYVWQRERARARR